MGLSNQRRVLGSQIAQASTLQIPNLFESDHAWSIVLPTGHKLRCNEHGAKRRHWFIYIPMTSWRTSSHCQISNVSARYAQALDGSTDGKDVVATGEL